MQLVSKVRHDLMIDVNVKDVFKYKTIENFCDNVPLNILGTTNSANSSTNQKIFGINHFNDFDPSIILNGPISTAEDTIFLFPPGQSGAESYLGSVARILGKTHKHLVLLNNYYSYLLNKLSDEEISSISMGSLASKYVAYMKTIQANGPYRLFGWSFGGLLAFEIGRQLIDAGDTVSSIVMVDCFSDSRTKNLAIDDVSHRKMVIPGANMSCLKTSFDQLNETNIILFKAQHHTSMIDMLERQRNLMSCKNQLIKISALMREYALLHNLDKELNALDMEIINMPHDHFSWINDAKQVEKICKALL